MKSKLLSGTGLIIIVAIVLAVNLFGMLLFRRAKVDLTEEKLYTLSKGTTKIIKSIPDSVRAEFYYSKTAAANVPPLKIYGDRVLQMLREYQDVSGGKIQLEVLDPRPDTELEEVAEGNGLQGVAPGNMPERIFMGLVLKDENDNKQTIAFFDPRREDSLEYDISKALYNVTHPERKEIGVLSSINVMGDSANPMMMMQQQPPAEQGLGFCPRIEKQFQGNQD